MQHKLLALLDQQMEPLQIAEVKGICSKLTLSSLTYHADGIAITLPKNTVTADSTMFMADDNLHQSIQPATATNYD